MLNTIQIIFDIIVSVLTVFGILWALISKVWGFSELLKRFGTVSSREISIVAELSSFSSLRKDLTDTGIIREKNVKQIDKGHLSEVKDSKLLLVDYTYLTDSELSNVLRDKSSKCGLIIYAPPVSPPRRLPDSVMEAVAKQPYTLLVNFRGRLVNDVLTAMMTTPR